MSFSVVKDSIEVIAINKELEIIGKLSDVEIEGIKRFVELESEGLTVGIELWPPVGCIESRWSLIVGLSRQVIDDLSEAIEFITT